MRPLSGAPNECAASVHLNVSSALGCTGGRRHEPFEISSSLACLQGCAAFPHLAATFMREVEAGHLLLVVVQATDKHRAGVAGMKLGFANAVCTEPFFPPPVQDDNRCGRGMSQSSVKLMD
jgi:hypothetical protein